MPLASNSRWQQVSFFQMASQWTHPESPRVVAVKYAKSRACRSEPPPPIVADNGIRGYNPLSDHVELASDGGEAEAVRSGINHHGHHLPVCTQPVRFVSARQATSAAPSQAKVDDEW
jgi:hypothetical protein